MNQLLFLFLLKMHRISNVFHKHFLILFSDNAKRINVTVFKNKINLQLKKELLEII